jgi:hypothetical protein
MTRNKGLELLLVTATFLGGCSVQASMKAGSTTRSRSETSSASARASSSGGSSRAKPNAKRAVARHEQELTTDPAEPSSPRPIVAARDDDRGHGNDADGVDEDNPGKSKGSKKPSIKAVDKKSVASADSREPEAPAAAGKDDDKKPTKLAGKKPDGDHDRGHGNDADGVDEDNPGKSKKVASGK